MDGREAMSFPNPQPHYYLQRGGPLVSGSAPQPGFIFQTPPGLRQIPIPNIQAQSSIRPAFSTEPRHGNFVRSIHMDISSSIVPAEQPQPPPSQQPHPPPSQQPHPPPSQQQPVVGVKKKRGRPRKYAPDGQVALGLSPLSGNVIPFSGSDPQLSKRLRGRPPGTGRKQRLANLGEWMNSSAGTAFAPHVLRIEVGEDIVAKVLSFAQQRPRAVGIMSGNGTVSSITLRQPTTTVPSTTYEGHFQILCLSGCYLVAEDGGTQSRTGGISVSLSTPEGHVIGGGVAVLIASSLIEVVLCSFIYGNPKMMTPTITPKNKQIVLLEGNQDSATQISNKPTTPVREQNFNVASREQNFNASHEQNFNAAREQNLNAAQQNLNAAREQNFIAREQNFNASREQNLNASREQNFNAAREQNLNASREQNFNVAREQNFNVAREQNLNASLEQNFGAAGEHNLNHAAREQNFNVAREMNLNASREQSFNAARDQNLNNASREQNFNPSREQNLNNASREQNFNPSRERNLNASREQNFSSSGMMGWPGSRPHTDIDLTRG